MLTNIGLQYRLKIRWISYFNIPSHNNGFILASFTNFPYFYYLQPKVSSREPYS